MSTEYAGYIEADPIRNQLHYPHVLRSLGDVKGKSILDVGCGNGRLDEILAARDARVIAYDKAPNLIQIARRQAEQSGSDIRYLVADPTNIELPEQFDAAVSVMVLPYAPDPHYLGTFFESTNRALKKDGSFISVVLNPNFTAFDQLIANRVFKRWGGNQVEVQFLSPKDGAMMMNATLGQFNQEEYEAAATRAGFSRIEWQLLMPIGETEENAGFWKACKELQPYSSLIVSR
ncbi:methyltransferase domain-containing protein [Patescibacteria group bacterium]|nr:methyltransferase domain-containing protein [Patescibacteria group bacterium]